MQMHKRVFLVMLGVLVAVVGGGTPADGGVSKVRLANLHRGINVSQWFSQVVDPLGLTEAHFISHTTQEDLQLIRRLGFDHVRLSIEPEPMFDVESPGQLPQEYLGYIDRAIDLILANDLAVIVDIHPGFEFRQKLSWDDNHVQGFVAFWRAFAGYLADRDPQRVFLEVLNEPIVPDPYRWATIQSQAIKAIRQAAPDHTIIATGRFYSGINDLLYLKPVADGNVVYNFHMYDPSLFTHQGADWGWITWKYLKAQVPYPVRRKQVDWLLDEKNNPQAVTHPGVRSELVKYRESSWGPKKISQEIARVAKWASRYGVAVTANEFGVFWPFAPALDRALWTRDVRVALERFGMGWTVWDYAGGFGIVYKENGRTIPNVMILKALGLLSKVPLREQFTKAVGHDDESFFSGSGQKSVLDWDPMLKGESAFAGSDGRVLSASVGAVLHGGPTGKKGDHGAAISIRVDPKTTHTWRGGIEFALKALPATEATQVILTGDVKAIEGGVYQLRIESGQEDYISFNAVGTGRWQATGGLLSMGEQTGQLDLAAENLKVSVRFQETETTWGDHGKLTVDNLMLAKIAPIKPARR